MKLSVVIPLYNKEKYIGQCLQSVLGQDLPESEYEIIVVDDSSTDSSYSIANGYAEKNGNIITFRQENGGAGAARNKGLEEAKGDYVYFIDADDYIAENVLNSLLEICYRKNLEILGFNTKQTSNRTLIESSTHKHQNPDLDVVDGMTYIARRDFRNEAWWYFIKRSFLLDTGIKFIEGRYLQDSIFTASLLPKTRKIAKVNFDIHRFVKVENSATTNKSPQHILKFIDDLVYAIEQFDAIIKKFDKSNTNYPNVVAAYKRKQQSFVFTLFIKAFRCPLIRYKDLKKIVARLKNLGVYPINRKIGGIGNKKTRFLYNLTFVSFFNTKTLLFWGLKFNKLISSH